MQEFLNQKINVLELMFSRTIRLEKIKEIRNFFFKDRKRKQLNTKSCHPKQSARYTSWRPAAGWASKESAVDPTASIARISLSNGGNRANNHKTTDK